MGERTTVTRIGCGWFDSNSLQMFSMVVKFFQTYTVWGQYLKDKHFIFFGFVLVLSILVFVKMHLLN